MKLSKQFRFEASHQISNHPGKCSRLHGHSWVLTVFCEGTVDPNTGMVLDYFHIKEAVQPIVDRLDHRHLGEGVVFSWELGKEVRISHEIPDTIRLFPLLPTSENLLIWIAGELPTTLRWSSLVLNETCTSSAELTFTEFQQIRRKERYHAPRQEAQYPQSKEAPARDEEAQATQDVKELSGDSPASPIANLTITDDDIPF